MSADDIIRAWRSEDYLLGLSSAERRALPENPAGAIELLDVDVESAACTHACSGCGSCWSGGTACCC